MKLKLSQGENNLVYTFFIYAELWRDTVLTPGGKVPL